MTNAWRGETEGTDLPIFGAGRDSVAGFDDPVASDAGVDVADALAFHGQGNPDAPVRSELVPVVLSGGIWGLRNKNGDAVHGQERDYKTRATTTLPSGDNSSRWFGLALIDTDPRDIRADLLALIWQRHMIGLERCIRYGAGYLLALGYNCATDVRQAAAADALLILAYRRTRRGKHLEKLPRHRRPTLRERERQFKLASGKWAPMRDAAEKAYRRRYREAAQLYAAVDDWRPLPNGRSFERGIKPDPLHRALWTRGRRRVVAYVEKLRQCD